MRLLLLAGLLAARLVGQAPAPAVPTIAAYQITSQMCASGAAGPFRLAPAIQCRPSVLISVFGMDPAIVRGYAIHVDYLAPDGSPHVETVYLPAVNGVASWTFYAADIHVVRIVAEPQRNADGVAVVVFP